MLWAIIFSILPIHAEVVDRVAAVVDDDVITLSDIYQLGGDFIETQMASPGVPPESRRSWRR